ncbi:Beta-ketoacyl synthase, active site-containing protein [Cynara cardunculus var. scolymus]|uniref:beta-ketoacyl-[acyl-carrier-protein] synthase I n=1 Tax=Cynara cardunculus var. scolymus TaxID=59895 RepID=A0A103YN88_CYNCS|nr:Beta-ketoacyl synthase, active site-containing protein [Cynara cardunculus var. scolymus]
MVVVSSKPSTESARKPSHPPNRRRVVVTGMGVETPIGRNPDEYYNNLLEAVGKKALADGGLTASQMEEMDKSRCGVLIGSGLGGMKIFSDSVETMYTISYKKLNPFCVPSTFTNIGSSLLAMDLGWMGPTYSISTACATSNFCILNATNHIIDGDADMMLCGGSEAPILPLGVAGFVACRALSERNDDPTKASRPWDSKRGANIYAEVLGGSFTSDAYHPTKPHPEGKHDACSILYSKSCVMELDELGPLLGTGAILCMEKALSQSGVTREDVNYINAHATSTPAGDIKEFQAIVHCFGKNQEAIQTGWVHPNMNLDNPDKDVDMNVLVGQKKERLDVKVAMSNSFGFGGHNSTILFAPFR